MDDNKKGKSKGGRPTLTVRKDIKLTVRLSRQEYFIVKEKAGSAGVTITFFIRQAAIKAKITSRLSTEEMQLIRQLAGMATNINQVARVCHREGLYEAMRYFGEYQKQFDLIMQKLKS